MKMKVKRLKKLKLKKLKVKKESATKVALFAFTMATAGAIGFLMQSGSPLEASAVVEHRTKLIASSIDSGLDANALLGCAIDVSATPAVAAMVNLSVSASCLPGDRVTVTHAGLTFTEVLDADGVLEISVPAMAVDAQFDVNFPNGYVAAATADVASLQFYDHVAVQWTGETGLQIHALEFGATYGDNGHVWFGNERDLTAVIGGRGGFLMRLGYGFSELSRMADVYTFPTVNAAEADDVQLTVEAEVNGANCGRAISATTLQVTPGSAPIKKTLNVEIPSCNATGDFLVLQNLLQDLTFAQKG